MLNEGNKNKHNCCYKTNCRRGYAEAEIEAVFAKYDVNGDRALDDAELRQMTNDLENQKVTSSSSLSCLYANTFFQTIWDRT